MAHVVSAIKQLLRVSDETSSVDPLRRACDMLQNETTSSATAPSELYILCCEAALARGEWDVAERCLRGLKDNRTATRVLEARALYCDALVALHDIPSGCRGIEKVEAHLSCATKIVTGIKEVLEEWPKEAHTLATGVEHLWTAIRDLFYPGTYENVLDTVLFVVTLHDKIGLGGPFSHLQWILRYAICLRGIGRYQDAATQLSVASEIVTKVGSERLQLQFFRVQIALSASIPGTRPKQDYSQPLLHALYAVQSFFCGITDASSSRAELIAAHDRLIGDPEKKEVRGRGKKNTEADTSFTDPGLVIDVLSEVVLGLALCGAEDTCLISLPKLLQSESVRPRLFGEYAQAILRARACGAQDAVKALDASYLTRSMADALCQCIKDVEGTMDSSRMIDDSSERSYTLEVGCTILWNLCLPLLQPETRGKLRHTLKRIALFLSQYSSGMKELRVRVAYESSLVEFEEDNLNTAIEQLDKALSLDYFVVRENGGVIFPMDFALLWLKRRAEVRKVVDGSTLSSQEDQVIHFIEQARTAASASNRLVLLQSAVNKLPPLGKEVDPTTEPPASEEKKTQKPLARTKKAKAKKTQARAELVEKTPPMIRTVTNPVAANVYHLLLKEAKEMNNTAVIPIIETVAGALTNIDVLDEPGAKDLLVIKADAHLSMAEVLATGIKTCPSADTKAASTTDAMMHISSAAKIGVQLCASGYCEEWIVINACLSLVNWCAEPFRKGHFLPAAGALGELYLALNQTRVDPVREFKVFSDVGFAYVVSFIQAYIALKGEVDGELRCETLAETLQKMYLYPVCEANNPILRQASDVSRELLSKWQFPSFRKHFCFLETCINRLLQRNQDHPVHPQDQVLIFLGRLNGPMTDADKRSLITKECMDSLRADPSVELCGRLAVHSARLPDNERTTMELCRIAENLYKSGNFGWCTKTPAYFLTGKDKGSHSLGATITATTGTAATNTNNLKHGSKPKPSEEDWYWFASILLYEANVLKNFCVGIAQTKRVEFEKRILVIITNSALAASNGPHATQSQQIIDAYHTLCEFAQCFDNASRHLLLPSLKMLLSPFMISKLRVVLGRVGNTEGGCSLASPALTGGASVDKDAVCAILTYMGGTYFRGLTETGGYKDGIKTMNELLGILPTKYHKVFTSFEAEFRCQLGLPTTQLLQKVKGADAETEAAVWVALAKNTQNIKESSKNWMKALEVLAEKPQEKADVLLAMAEWMTTRNAITTRDLSSLLLSALDAVENFTETHQRTLNLEHSPSSSNFERGTRQAFLSSLAGRSQFMSSGASSSMMSTKTRRLNSSEALSFRNVFTDVRILYILFVIAPETTLEDDQEFESLRIGNENIDEQGNGQKDEGEDAVPRQCGSRRLFPSSKSSCASVIAHYVSSLWCIVARRVEAALVEAHLPQTSSPPPELELPKEHDGWLGFSADSSHVDIIRSTCADDAVYNTEDVQAMLLDVSDFLVEEQNMESCAFLLLSWVNFAAQWRYGVNDARAVSVTRLVALRAFAAAARAGCGDRSACLAPPAVDAPHWSALREALGRSGGPTPSAAPLPALFFARGRGAPHRCVLAVAEAHLSQGRAADALRWAAAAAPCARRVGDTVAEARACLVALRVRALVGESGVADALAELAEKRSGAAGPLALWADIHAARVDALRMCGQINAAVMVARDVSARLQQPHELHIPEENCAARDVALAAAHACHRKLLREWARDFAVIAARSSATDAAAARSFVRDTIEALREMGDWRSRLVALRASQTMRSVVDAKLLYNATADDVRSLLAALHEEHAEATAIADAAHTALVGSVSPVAYARGVAAHPSAQSVLDEALVLRARNCIERSWLCDAVVLRYRSLTMAELQVATTEAPANLEQAVLEFMRGPQDYDDDDDDRNGVCVISEAGELSSALAHFRIPPAHVAASGWATAEPMLCRARGDGDGRTPLRVEAAAAAALAEFARRLRALCRATAAEAATAATAPTAAGARDGARESAALTRAWAAGAIAVPERPTGPRGNRRSASAVAQRRRSRAAAAAAEAAAATAAESAPAAAAGASEWAPAGLPALLAAAGGAALRALDGRRAAKCFLALAHTHALSCESIAAATAAEFALAATTGAFIVELQETLTAHAAEGVTRRTADAMRTNAPFLYDTSAFDAARAALCAACGAQRRMDLAREWPKTPNAANPLPPDCCTLTIVRDDAKAHFLVAFRRPDGDVHIRRVELDVAAVVECGDELETTLRLAKSEAAAPSFPSVPSASPTSTFAGGPQSVEATAAPATTTSQSTILLQALFERVRQVTEPLLIDFLEILGHFAPTCHLFLCLDPSLHMLPFERLGVFASFLSVQRELSVLCVRQKISQRTAKSSSAGVVLVVDPFAEHSPSIPALIGFADGRGKSSANELVGATREPSGALRRPSHAYVARAMASPQYSALLVNMCGSFTGAVAPASIAAMPLDHVQVALIAEATNTASLRREQHHWASQSSKLLFYEKQWVVALLLLARGVHYFGMCIAPLAPENADALSKRCVPIITAGGRGLYESVQSASKAMGEPPFVFYGVPPVGKH